MDTCSRYKIIYSHGLTSASYETYEDALAAVREVYGQDVEVGHSGDISDGGESTLCWTSAEVAENDDGSRACCRIRKTYQESLS